jgi:phospholipase C
VIFQENVSFDHYFGTYPNAKNLAGEIPFISKAKTPTVNGFSPGLLTANPNGVNPYRQLPSQAAMCDQDHGYTDEQAMADGGLMDNFVKFTSDCSSLAVPPLPPNQIMDYFDGNTVTALWNYAQFYAMNDNSFNTTFGPSSPGAINLVSGFTGGAVQEVFPSGYDDIIAGSLIDDAQPFYDTCTSRDSAKMTGTNIGNLLNTAGLTWGWFQGGFDLTLTNSDGSTGCKRDHTSAVTGVTKTDYIPHHEPFQYYLSTANPFHMRPSSIAAIGTTDAANHQYDMHDFFDALAAGNLPAVSFIKAPGYQDGHAGYSDPFDEQMFVVDAINTIEKSPFWRSTAIIITYDDSDGFYDHQMPPIVRHSQTADDALNGPELCGGSSLGAQAQGRCGYGPRVPYLVVSPWARTNFVDHSITDGSSTIKFIEDNWSLPGIGGGSADATAGSIKSMFDFSKTVSSTPPTLILDPLTGQYKR